MELSSTWTAAGVVVAVQIIGFVIVIATMRADLRNLKEWVKRIDRDVDEHIQRHPGPTTYGGDD